MKLKSFRYYIKKAHLYFGLFFGTPLVLIGLTGSILVSIFAIQDIPFVANPSHPFNADQISRIVDALDEQNPNGKILSIKFPKEANDNIVARMQFESKSQNISISSNTFVVSEPNDGLTKLLVGLHSNFLIKNGDYFVGICGIFLVILSISGTILWYLQLSRIKLNTAAKLPRRILLKKIHYYTGLYTVCALVFIGLSGLYLTFPNSIAGNLRSAIGARDFKSIKLESEICNNPLHIGRIYEIAKISAPAGSEISNILFPSNLKQTYKLTFLGEKPTIIFIDQCGTILDKIDWNGYTASEKALYFISAIHKSNVHGVFGWIWKLCQLIVGLSPIAFSVTGFMVYFGKKSPK